MAAQRDDEVGLLERAMTGDRDAFGQIAEEHRDALLRLCYKMTGSREEAEDLVQETLLKAYSKFGTFQLRSSIGTWLYRIATNACLDHQRERKPWDLDRRFEWFRENDELAKNVEQSLFLNPERAAEVKEVAATCINCITMSLPAKQRAAIVLCDQAGLSREEAANAIGASVASVKTELHRARKAMTEVFEHHCALVDQKNECNACMSAGLIKRSQHAADAPPARPAPTDASSPATCAEVRPLLSDLMDGDVAADVRERAEGHIASCGACAKAQRALRRSVRFVRANAGTTPAAGTPGRQYEDFHRAIMDDSFGRTPLEVLLEGLAPRKEGAE